MISLARINFKPIEEDGFPENTELNQKVETAIQQITAKLAEIDFADFDVQVELSGQLYNSVEPFKFVNYEILPDFTPDDIKNEIHKVLMTEFSSCLGHLQSFPNRIKSQ